MCGEQRTETEIKKDTRVISFSSQLIIPQTSAEIYQSQTRVYASCSDWSSND